MIIKNLRDEQYVFKSKQYMPLILQSKAILLKKITMKNKQWHLLNKTGNRNSQ